MAAVTGAACVVRFLKAISRQTVPADGINRCLQIRDFGASQRQRRNATPRAQMFPAGAKML
jgi:hypothetical protein